MAYVNVPKDLTKVKTKVLFNLTKPQLICFGSGALIGVPLFFLLKGSIGTSPAAMVMMVVMIRLCCSPCMKRTVSRWRSSSETSTACAFRGQSSARIRPTISMPFWSGKTS